MACVKCFLMVVGLSVVAFAGTDSVDGSWKGSMHLNNSSDQPACMTVKQEGSAVSGTAGSCAGKQFPITKGTIGGGLITIEAHPGTPTLKFVMKLAENKLTGDVYEDDQKIGTISMEKASK